MICSVYQNEGGVRMKRLTTKQKNEKLVTEGKKLHHYGLRFRALPTPSQLEKINQFIGSSRFAFNFYLKERQNVYRSTKESLSVNTFKKSFNSFKQHPSFSWLKQVDKFALESAIESVEDAFKRFFNGQNKFPRLKKKHKSKQSYTTKLTNNNIELDIENRAIKLPKLGWVKTRFSKSLRDNFVLKGRVLSATVTRHSSGEVFISLKMEDVIDLQEKQVISSISDKDILGCDMGLLHFLITSKGDKIENPRYLKNNLRKLASLQRKLRNKRVGSSNYKKAQQSISKLHLHIANMRKDFLHKVSRKLVNENQVIVLEDLNVKNMIQNKRLARSIADVGWGMFKTFITYKANWANKYVVLVDTFFPSSKMCHGCKEKHTLLSLSERVWVCPKCGIEHDRDENAAQNIKEEGKRILLSS